MEYTINDLENFTVPVLQQICRDNGIKRFSTKRKSQIIDMILSFQRRRRAQYTPFFEIFFNINKFEEDKNSLKNITDSKTEIESEQCLICLSNKKIISPKCGHLVTCKNCSITLQEQQSPKCPICREEWKEPRRIFY